MYKEVTDRFIFFSMLESLLIFAHAPSGTASTMLRFVYLLRNLEREQWTRECKMFLEQVNKYKYLFGIMFSVSQSRDTFSLSIFILYTRVLLTHLNTFILIFICYFDK